MQAETVKTLVGKARFQPDVAVAIAEAMDQAISSADLVTVLILDARFAKADAKVSARFAEAEAKVNARFAEADAKFATRFAEAEARISARFAEVDARFLALEARIDAKLARMETRLILWILAINVGNSYLPQIVSKITAGIGAIFGG